MPSQIQPTAVYDFQGGFATDLAQQVRSLTFLTRAENVLYGVNKAVRKVGGSTRLNSTTITSSPDVVGMYDFWVTGTGGTFTQYFVAVTGNGKVINFGTGGTESDITGAASITASTIPVFAQMGDLLLIFTNDNDTPLKWSGSGDVASIGGSIPAGRGAVIHLNRVWTWGDNSNPSTITYGTADDPESYTGGDSGSIIIDNDDGDRIVGAVSHKDRLVVFKGPNRGSIHIIEGRAVADFLVTRLTGGIPLQTHNSIVEVGDDIWFMSDRGIHSLAATERFGNFASADLSRFLTTFFADNITRTNLNRVWGANYTRRSSVLWSLTDVAKSEPDLSLGISYILGEEEGLKPFTWTGRSNISMAIRNHPTTRVNEVVFGSTDGFVNRQDVSDRNINTSTAYTMRVTTPQLVLAPANPRGDQPVDLRGMYMRSRPVGNYDITVAVQRDNLTAESYTFDQGQSGFLLGTSVLDTGILGGSNLQTVVEPNMVGEARAIGLDITQGGLDQDADIYEIGIDYDVVGTSTSTSLTSA
ncbi:hypothetical protein CMI37_07300 [Candidatus Pacearchaeota archaeon]|nr:hypothetical protein [Candidatus Pacearchaeota archaeon]